MTRDVTARPAAAISVAALMLALSWGGRTYPWASPTILGLFARFVVGLAVLIAVERSAPEPVMPPS